MKLLILILLAMVILVFGSGSADAQICSLDVFGVDVVDEHIRGNIENSGDDDVSFTVFVNSEEVANGTLYLGTGETGSISNAFSFSPGEYTITVQATSPCGAFDAETILHTVLEDFSCSSPSGIEGQNFCNYYNQEYQVCRSGSWQTLDVNGVEYCSACQLTCGDGVCNCGESIGSCSQDCSCQEGVEYQCSGSMLQQIYKFNDCSSSVVDTMMCPQGCSNGGCSQICEEKFTPETICSGDVRKQKFISSDCDERFVSVQYCEFGCISGICQPPVGSTPGSCSVSLVDMEFVDNLQKWDKGYVKATVENHGSKGTVKLSFTVNGDNKENASFIIARGAEASKTFFFTPRYSGTHFAEVSVRHSCGAQDSEVVAITVPPQVQESKVSFQEAPQEQGETLVTISPPTIDVPVYTGDVVSLHIQSAVPQLFVIDVSGVPEGFASFDDSVFIDGEETVYVYLTPTDLGTYNFIVSATAEDETIFSREIELFVVPHQVSSENGFVVPELLPVFIAVVAIIIVATIIIGIVVRRRKENEYVNYLSRREF